MYGKRTDLAVEEQELRQENAQDGAPLSGVVSETRTQRGFPLTTVRIEDESAAKELCKPMGTYVTMEAGRLLRRESGARLPFVLHDWDYNTADRVTNRSATRKITNVIFVLLIILHFSGA